MDAVDGDAGVLRAWRLVTLAGVPVTAAGLVGSLDAPVDGRLLAVPLVGWMLLPAPAFWHTAATSAGAGDSRAAFVNRSPPRSASPATWATSRPSSAATRRRRCSCSASVSRDSAGRSASSTRWPGPEATAVRRVPYDGTTAPVDPSEGGTIKRFSPDCSAMSETETVFVTGGTGFIGSYVAEDLLSRGHEVVAYDLNTDPRILEKLGVEDDVEIVRGDVTESTDVIRAVRESGATRIIHLAALLTTTAEEHPRAALDVNVTGTSNVFEAAATLDDQVERVAWASSAAIFAPPRYYDDGADWWVTEDDLVKPDTLYGATKEYNEHQARVYREAHGLDDVAIRPTVAYGAYRETGGSAFLANIVEKPALGEPFSVEYGDQEIDWQHVRDIAQGFRLAAFADADDLSRRVYNVRGELASVREAAETVERILPDADITVSDEGELPWTQRLDMTKAREELGYEPEYDLETGFRQYIDVLREEAGLEPV